MTEPLTPAEEAQWRSWLASGHMPGGNPAMHGERIARLLATLDATRKIADEGLADGLRPDGFLLTDDQLDDRDNAIHPDSPLARARSGLVLVRTGSGGVFQDGTTNTPAIDFATRALADEGLAGEPTTEAGRRLAEAIASLDERLPIDPGDAILAIEAEAAEPLWRVAWAAGALQAAWDAVNAPTAKVEDYSRLDDAYDKAGADLRKALAALDATVKETP